MDSSEWNKLWAAVTQIQDGFEPGAVFIGGVAVFAHTGESERYKDLVAFSHDADLMISVSDYTDLKDIEQVTPNRRLRKSQFYKSGFEFDLYVESQNDLPVPYGEVSAFSEMRQGVRSACLEHLVVLKLKAFEDRKGSAKGEKDEDDLLKILLLVGERGTDADRTARIDDSMLEVLSTVASGEAPLRVAGGNAHRASFLRKEAKAAVVAMQAARNNTAGLGW